MMKKTVLLLFGMFLSTFYLHPAAVCNERSYELPIEQVEGDDRIRCAAKQGLLDIVREHVVERNADVELVDHFDRSLLFLAVRHLPVVKFLVKHGANVNARNTRGGRSVLIHALCYGSKQVVTYLLSNENVDLTLSDGHKMYPIHYACGLGTVYHGLPKDRTEEDYILFTSMILQRCPGELGRKHKYGGTPAQVAGETVLKKLVKFLLDTYDADVNEVNVGLVLFLAWHSLEGLSMKEVLSEDGFSQNARDCCGCNPLLVCIEKGGIDMIDTARTLIEFGADLSVRDRWGRNVVCIARIQKFPPSFINYLIEHGAEDDASNGANNAVGVSYTRNLNHWALDWADE